MYYYSLIWDLISLLTFGWKISSTLFCDGDQTGILLRCSSSSVALALECDLSKQSDIQQKFFLRHQERTTATEYLNKDAADGDYTSTNWVLHTAIFPILPNCSPNSRPLSWSQRALGGGVAVVKGEQPEWIGAEANTIQLKLNQNRSGH